ncbi:anti-sigma-K factor RskA [Paenibacillus sp. 32O-W]|uniref:anti-sigma factor n=1 Tax=Paenibacillus sp. 32O-W TaxID=1695218 RepID=UPI0007223C88|nr:anti-sigma factor [Paenibacillus sp. 32O-W]ALS28261.1 anti-sigma-K factor RskA [Paenibacillus sp. 32O-W]
MIAQTGNGSPKRQCERGIGEQTLVDWLLGRLPDDQHRLLAAHVAECPACSGIADIWRPLLAPPAAADGSALPSESVRGKLRRRLRLIGLRRSIRQHSGKWMVAAACAIMLLTALAGLFHIDGSSERRNRYVAEHEPAAVAFLNDPFTANYHVRLTNHMLGEGYIWFNDNSHEALILLEGTLPSDGYALQVWAVKGDGHAKLGTLSFKEKNLAHLFVKAEALTSADNIVLTMEPRGSSSLPSSEALVFMLQRR